MSPAAGLNQPAMTAAAAWWSPGRVNLIGEHTDYNGGFAMPVAIQAGCLTRVTVGPARLRIVSAQRTEVVTADLSGLAPDSLMPDWARYLAGVVWAIARRGYRMPGLEIAVDSDVPPGAGLASSAALTCSTVAAVSDVLRLGLHRHEWVAIARQAENEFVNAPTGGLDQLASVYSVAGCALLADMKRLSTTELSLDLAGAGLSLMVIDSRTTHQHSHGEYQARRASCDQAAALLKVPTLRAVQDYDHIRVLAALRAACARQKDPDAELLQRRVRHVLTENRRVQSVAACLRTGNVAGIGPYLTASHRSMRNDYEITTPPIDLAVATAIGAGALGARMTGGGFGGCVIALVPAGTESEIHEHVTAACLSHGYPAPEWFTAIPSSGTRVSLSGVHPG